MLARGLAHAPCCGAIWRRIMDWSGSKPGTVRRAALAPACAGGTILASQESRFEFRIGRKTGQTRSEPICTSGAPQQARAEARSTCAYMDLRVKLEPVSERMPVGAEGNCVLTRAGRTIRKGKIYDSSKVMTRPTIAEKDRLKCEDSSLKQPLAASHFALPTSNSS